MASYLVLMGYTGLTLIEALRTPSVTVRHVMNIETTVTLVAALAYGYFNELIKQPTVDLHEITKIRYIDWSITTPLILLVIMLFYNPDHSSFETYGQIVLLNWGMLLMGYLGEQGTVSRWLGFGGGFAFFAAVLVLLYSCCIPAKANHTVFYIFAAIWSVYGIVYLLDEEKKNIGYNILDVVSKALFGVILYFYFGKVLEF
jgi:bacteriorhodopsin